jgi:hypothetical protein
MKERKTESKEDSQSAPHRAALGEERRKVTETVKNNPVRTLSGGSWVEMETEMERGSPSRRQRDSHLII